MQTVDRLFHIQEKMLLSLPVMKKTIPFPTVKVLLGNTAEIIILNMREGGEGFYTIISTKFH